MENDSMLKQRAERNRTLTLDEKEIKYYLTRCISINNIDKYSSLPDSIIYGDTLSVSVDLPDNFVDLLIVDPPYNLNKTFGDSRFKKMSDDEYVVFTNLWISQIKHTLKPFASIYVCCDWRSSIVISNVIKKYFNIQNRITWQREKGRGAIRNWKNAMEDIWFATMSPKDYTFDVENVKMRRKVIAPYKVDGKPKDWIESIDGNFRDTYPSNFWDDISIPYWSMPENTNHPTQKPEKLIAKLILASSNVGDMVLDPFLGSGTTAVVAKKLKRHFLGIENECEYCALSQKRLELAANDSEIQGYSGNVFWERNTLALQQKFKYKKDSMQLSLTSVVSEPLDATDMKYAE
jgi:site-specific DNA-methyltransferase (adenine-specific)